MEDGTSCAFLPKQLAETYSKCKDVLYACGSGVHFNIGHALPKSIVLKKRQEMWGSREQGEQCSSLTIWLLTQQLKIESETIRDKG